MYYSAIGSLAILVLLIENYDILFKRGGGMDISIRKAYRRFLFSILIYFVTDVLWGVFEDNKMATMLFIDTLVYFVSLSFGVLFWTQYVVAYLRSDKPLGKALLWFGRIFFGTVTLLVAVNIFTPVLFWVDEDCVYHANTVRYVILIVQIMLLVLLSGYALAAMLRRDDASKKRFRTIAFCGLIMAVFLTVQIWFPYLPLYTIAYMMGTCLLHAFVVSDEKDEYKQAVENAYEREKKQFEELKAARELAYKDALTGVKSKLAYVEAEKEKDAGIIDGSVPDFAVAVFDINGLKAINDKFGHERGDQYIIAACEAICSHFKHSPVFRIGGDEFVALLERGDYQNRHELEEAFDRSMDGVKCDESPVVAMGMAVYDRENDEMLNDVFVRADKLMYLKKNSIKN